MPSLLVLSLGPAMLLSIAYCLLKEVLLTKVGTSQVYGFKPKYLEHNLNALIFKNTKIAGSTLEPMSPSVLVRVSIAVKRHHDHYGNSNKGRHYLKWLTYRSEF